MRIQVVGGGPAGLYFALLMRRADPGHQVTVTERNPDGATFGWGVVFSEETLGSLRDADPESHAAVTDSFARWDAIEIRYRDEVVRSRGHAFTGIARPRLLAVLRDRCRDLGVDLRFEHEVPDPFALEADLVLAADGVNSFTRRARPEAFGASEQARGTKFVWLGVDHAFRAFTFIFRDTPHGMFQVHAYPFDGQASTFIVECHESTWRAAGLEDATERDTIAFCQELFAEELGGRRLMSNRSMWASFVTVRCESWHQGRLALAGDAAHTAHFTIGSGTKLAMEDSIALAQALRRHKDVEQALVEYEMERQPVVDRFQQAAAESASYFENVRRYAAFAPIQFGFNLLTRSGRIGHTNLSLRDPDFVRRVDAWFADRVQDGSGVEHPSDGDDDGKGGVAATDRGGRRTIAAPPLFAPLSLRGLRLPNRAVLSPVSEDGAEDGAPQDAHLSRLTAAARSGAGLVLTEVAAVSAQGRVTPGSVGMYLDGHVGAWSRVTWFVHELTEARIGLQLGHAGRRASMRPRRLGVDRPLRSGNWPLLSASALPYGPRSQTPLEVDERDIVKLIDQFTEAARMAEWADFDLLELNMAQGYLLASFLSPLTNVRDDEYGGSAENRLRFPLRVFDAVRGVWPEDRPLTACIPATDWAPGGLDVDDAVEIAKALHGRGCDAVRILAGQTITADRPDYARMYLVPPADRIRNEAAIPVLVGGGLTTPDQANTILAAGRADLCLLDLPRQVPPGRRWDEESPGAFEGL